MDTYHPSLDYFLIIAKHLNLTKAAKEVHVSQQNLSIYLKKLEDYYHVQLFSRRPNLRLTPAGEVLLQSALQIQQVYCQLDQKLKPFTEEKKQVTLGCCRAKLPDVMGYFHISSYQKNHPDVEIKIIEDNSTVLDQELTEYHLDFYIGNASGLSKAREYFLLQIYPYRLAVSPELLKQYYGDEVTAVIAHWEQGVILREVTKLPYISSPSGHLRHSIEEYAALHQFHFHLAAEHSNPDRRIQMCCHRLGFVITEIPAEELKQMGLLSFPIAEPDITLPLACIRRAGEDMPNYMEDFWKLIQEKEGEREALPL
ncbi:LysR family transcriptional regulator [Hominifimenecus sp. rT4P-3]|uniref:LysR family transcriptional regulator n=1 Tax=Hominifimenecus sp. rT4P-3 TaxID=3242979 RepID=UPI003DA1CEEE